VVGLGETPWETDRLRSRTRPGGEGAAHFEQIGVALYRLPPGGAMSMYHHEAGQEDFLVLAGRPLLLVEEAERRLAPWDLVHCPPRTPHTIVNRAEEPALIFAVGARVERGSARSTLGAGATPWRRGSRRDGRRCLRRHRRHPGFGSRAAGPARRLGFRGGAGDFRAVPSSSARLDYSIRPTLTFTPLAQTSIPDRSESAGPPAPGIATSRVAASRGRQRDRG
jgi:quercetin dioxygenase-like cupin family protein